MIHVVRKRGLHIAFFGSSLVSAYWNGAATYYRGIVRALHVRGHRVTFYEPDAFDRQNHRDLDDPDWAEVVVYDPHPNEARRMVERAGCADVIVKASGVGVNDALLEEAVAASSDMCTTTVFWDVDAPATLAALEGPCTTPLRHLVPQYDLVLTYGGGAPVIDRYTHLGARACVPIYNAVDPSTHHPTAPVPRFQCELGFLGNRLPDRESRVHEFFLRPAAGRPRQSFLLGGNGWDQHDLPDNVKALGHVFTADHNAFNCTPRAVLNISRESMAEVGHSPATRVFEAAGAGACLISDAWDGLERFLEPGNEVLVANSGDDVAAILESLEPRRALCIGRKARQRVLAEHTYEHRADELIEALTGERWTAGGARG
jgi:spore maturation protein CgeB